MTGVSMPEDPGPMVRRRQLGSTLRRYRNDAGMSVKEVAELLLCSPSKISRIENAQRNATLRDVRDLCNIYGIINEARQKELMLLARESRERGWWQDSNLDPALETLIGLEGAAKKVKEYESLLVPGLLQTRDYAQAILSAFHPGDPIIRQPAAADVRIRRQQILAGESRPDFNVVLDEAALHRAVGGKDVMRLQIEHLINMAESAVVQLQVIPFSTGAYIGMINGFTILSFAEVTQPIEESIVPTVVYVEGATGDTYHDRPGEVEQFVDAFARLHEQAMSPSDTLKLLRGLTSGQ
jgi:transcriptional regulator with XRE-family HTH domain